MIGRKVAVSDATYGSHTLTNGDYDDEKQEHLLIELLRPSIGLKPARALAPSLLRRFGSLPAVMAAPPRLMKEFPGIGARTAETLAMSYEISVRIAQDRISDLRPILVGPALNDYLHLTMSFRQVECARVLYLDKGHRLIADEIHQVGTIDSTPFYLREVIRRTIELSASAILLVHNHPSGRVDPSEADLRCTEGIIELADKLYIDVVGHVILGRDGHTLLTRESLKRLQHSKLDARTFDRMLQPT